MPLKVASCEASGNFMFDFNRGGSYNYNLNVQTTGPSYALAGGGNVLSAANPSFQTGGTVTGLGCTTGCSAALAGGNLIQGAFFGPNGERIGLQYGINASVGQIFGTAVLK